VCDTDVCECKRSVNCTINGVIVSQYDELILNCLKQVSNSSLTSCMNLRRFVTHFHNAHLWSLVSTTREQSLLWITLKHFSCNWGLEMFGLCCWPTWPFLTTVLWILLYIQLFSPIHSPKGLKLAVLWATLLFIILCMQTIILCISVWPWLWQSLTQRKVT